VRITYRAALSAPRLEIHLEHLQHNATTMVNRLARQGIKVTGVSKATLGLPEIVHTWVRAPAANSLTDAQPGGSGGGPCGD
jgi:predicted amino acid racemase